MQDRNGPPTRPTEMNYFRFVQWDITSRCNLSCIHCRSESFYGDTGLAPDLPLADVKARLDELYDKGIRRIHFLGGEPFSRRDLPDIVRHATDLGILCSVNTNGTLITRAIAEKIVDAGTYLTTFSIDGFDAATNDRIRGDGTFKRILRGIEHLHAARRSRASSTRMICSHVLMHCGDTTGCIDLRCTNAMYCTDSRPCPDSDCTDSQQCSPW